MTEQEAKKKAIDHLLMTLRPVISVFSFQNNLHRFGINAVFFLEDPLRERLVIVIVMYGNGCLEHDRPCIKILVDEMNRAAGKFHAVLKRLFLRFKSGKGR